MPAANSARMIRGGIPRVARFMRIARSAATGLVLIGLPSAVMAAPAAGAATSVTPGTVKPGDTTAGNTTDYTLTFHTSATGGLSLGSTITFSAPAGTVFPSCSVSCGNYTVSASSGPVVVTSATPSGSSVKVTLGVSTVGAGASVTAQIAGVKNPTATSTGNSVLESTSADTSAVPTTNVYSITPAAVASVSVVSGANQTAQVGTTFHDPLVVILRDGYGNAEGAGIDVVFSAPTCSGGSSCATATFSGGSSSETVPTGSDGIAAGDPPTANATAGGYDVTASVTTSNITYSATFPLLNTSNTVQPGTVTLDPSSVEGAQNVIYSVPFTTSSTGALVSGQTITLDMPTGTILPTGASSYSVGSGATSVSPSAVDLPAPSEAVLTLGSAVPASTLVTVTVQGVTNPTVVSSSYSIYESTSEDGVAASPAYPIVVGAVALLTVVSGTPQTAAINQTFPQTLDIRLTDQGGNAIPNASVTFTAPASGASATFSSGQTSDTETTGTDGTAASVPLTANSTPGSYLVSASVSGVSTSFHLQNVVSLTGGAVVPSTSLAGATASYSISFSTSSNGACQPTCSVNLAGPSGTGFPTGTGAYAISVTNGHKATVNTVSVSPSGNSVTIGLAGSTIAGVDTVTVNTTGVTNPTLANGSYTFAESTSVDTAPVSSNTFAITPGPAVAMQAVLGDGQSALVYNPFASPLIAQVTDAYGNGVAGIPVTFAAPDTMGGAAFSGCSGAGSTQTQCVSTTDSSGYAVASELVAGSTGGGFQISVSATGLPGTVFDVEVVQSGYWLVASDGGLFTHGGAPYEGSEGGAHLNKPIVGMSDAANGGYYMVASDGGVFTFGGAPFYGSTGSMRLNAPVVGMAVDPVTGGYWLVASDGGIFNFGAPFWGSEGGTHLNKPIVGMAATPQGGYYLVASDGGIFNFGPGATFYGSEGGTQLNQPVVGMAETPEGGYYMVARDGGIFNFGPGAIFQGSAAGETFAPIVGMAVDPATGGYWLTASNGSVFNFGDAPFYGDEGNHPLNQPVVAIATSAGA